MLFFYQVFDTDGDGHIDTQEMKDALGDEEEITKAFMIFDEDQNGYIEYIFFIFMIIILLSYFYAIFSANLQKQQLNRSM